MKKKPKTILAIVVKKKGDGTSLYVHLSKQIKLRILIGIGITVATAISSFLVKIL